MSLPSVKQLLEQMRSTIVPVQTVPLGPLVPLGFTGISIQPGDGTATHTHRIKSIDAKGNGETNEVDGHSHEIEQYRIKKADGHAHQFHQIVAPTA